MMSNKSKPTIIKIERTERPNDYRVYFDSGGSVIVRATKCGGYWLDDEYNGQKKKSKS